MFTLGRYPVHIEQNKGKQLKHKQTRETENCKRNKKENKSKLKRRREKQKKTKKTKRKKRKSKIARLKLAGGEVKQRRSSCHATTAVAAFCSKRNLRGLYVRLRI